MPNEEQWQMYGLHKRVGLTLCLQFGVQGRGDERERQQREQLSSMERKVESSIREADATENKLELMEAIIKKLKVGSEEVYIR